MYCVIGAAGMVILAEKSTACPILIINPNQEILGLENLGSDNEGNIVRCQLRQAGSVIVFIAQQRHRS